jgi:hypothetical protein
VFPILDEINKPCYNIIIEDKFVKPKKVVLVYLTNDDIKLHKKEIQKFGVMFKLKGDNNSNNFIKNIIRPTNVCCINFVSHIRIKQSLFDITERCSKMKHINFPYLYFVVKEHKTTPDDDCDNYLSYSVSTKSRPTVSYPKGELKEN